MVLSSITADMPNKKTQNHKIPNHATVFKCEVILNWSKSPFINEVNSFSLNSAQHSD